MRTIETGNMRGIAGRSEDTILLTLTGEGIGGPVRIDTDLTPQEAYKLIVSLAAALGRDDAAVIRLLDGMHE